MKTKKAQTEIIVTVLLVLIALAAVAAIAYFIVGQVRSGTDSAKDKADCLKAVQNFEITRAVINPTGLLGDNVVLKKGTDDSVALKEIRIYVNDVYNTTTSTLPAVLGTKAYNITAVKAAGDDVKVYLVLNSSGTICETPISKAAVTA